jgi:hypothetical protein
LAGVLERPCAFHAEVYGTAIIHISRYLYDLSKGGR